jgi:hypothetical protein
MLTDGGGRDEELLCDLCVRVACSHELEQLTLPAGEILESPSPKLEALIELIEMWPQEGE